MNKLSSDSPVEIAALPPGWAIRGTKSMWQHAYDFIGAPLRMAVLPDATSERLHLTSLRGERLGRVLLELCGRVLDVGAGDNALLRLYAREAKRLGVDPTRAQTSVGVDVVDWGGGCTIIKSSAELPFEDASFDTVAYVACLNHIPEREQALVDARRVLRPGGRVVMTMIGRVLGTIGHAIWWYSEDKHRDVDEHEEMGLDHGEIIRLFDRASFKLVKLEQFVYRLNHLYVFESR